MEQIPPHLPPPTCSIPMHARFRSLKTIFAISGISLLAGFAGTACMLAWVWPYFGSDNWKNSVEGQSAGKPILSDNTRHEILEKTLNVYSRTEYVGDGVGYFAKKDYLGRAAVVSSDGWLVMLKNADNFGAAPSVVVFSQKVLKVEKTVEDKEAKVVYLKVSAPDMAVSQSGQFKIMSFMEGAKNLDDVFVFNNGNWQASSLVDRGEIFLDSAHLDSLPVSDLKLSGDFGFGSLVVSPDGKLVGFVGSNNILVPVEVVSRTVSGVLTKEKIEYKSLGIDGWFGTEITVATNGLVRNGFLVNKVRDSASKLRRGDLVLEVNNNLVTQDVWWSALTTGPVAKLRVFRQGKEILLESPVVTINK